jgi:flagellar biosynthetic protein FliR
MTSRALLDLLPANLFALLLVFCRVGAALQWLPGFGAAYIPIRVRIVLGVLISIVTVPVLASSLPAMPAQISQAVALVILELVIGTFFGLYGNLLVAALQTAGGIIAMQSSLASALVFNPGEEKQETLPAALFGALAVVMIFATDLHHVMLATVIDSYRSFPAGAPLPIGDMADTLARLTERGFEIAIRLAAPYLLLGTLFYLALGLIGRVMPQLQIFYVGLPLQVLGGLGMLLLTIPVSMLWFLGVYQNMFADLARIK